MKFLRTHFLQNTSGRLLLHHENRVKTGIALSKLPKDPALRKKWLQVIQRYRRTGRANKFSKTKKSYGL